MLFRLAAALLLTAAVARAGTLPGGLSPDDVSTITQALGFGGTTRLLRSAEAYPSWPGIKLAIEMTVAPSKSANDLGDRTGSVPFLNLLPRIYLAKGIAGGAELILSALPTDSHGGLSAWGGILKWTFLHEKEGDFLAGAAYAGYTAVRAYRGDYSGNNTELGVLFSKDYVRLKPYLGAGLLLAQGTVRASLAKTATVSALEPALHAFAGAEWELPINVGVQIDFMNLTPTGTLFVGKKF